MRRARSWTRAARRDTGAVLVLVALAMPVLIGAAGLVIDVGNWFAHRRHLQVQADAGALAAAGKYVYPCDGAAETVIKNTAGKYSGPSAEYPSAGYNAQIGGTPNTRVHIRINSPTWYAQATPTDDSVSPDQPCGPNKPMIDVKMTETDLPWLLRAANVDYINAQARLEIRQELVSRGALPIGVPDVNPTWARAYFVDETKLTSDAGYVIASTDLKQSGVRADGIALWSNPTSGTPAVPIAVPVTVNTSDIGVRIALGGNASPVTGSLATVCAAPLVSCFTAGGPNGLVHIRGYSTAGTGTATAPIVRDAQLISGSCSEDAYFTATSASDPCTIGVRAVIEGLPSTATVFAQRATGSNTKAFMTLSGGVWTSTSNLPINAGEGPVDIKLFFGSGNGTSLGTVQRSFAGTGTLASSGPLKLATVSENGVSLTNSFASCATCTHNLVVTIGLSGNLKNATTTGDPLVTLKVTASSGSQTQALDCENRGSFNLRDQLANGCTRRYTPNTGAATCPNGTTLRGTTEPWQCVAINTGAATGQVAQGMNLRILGDTNPSGNPPAACAANPNNWAMFPNFPPGDKRVVHVFLTPFGTFEGSGNDATVPVSGFATFYVTSWSSDPCNDPTKPAGQAAIVGHFIKYVDTINGEPGPDFCNFNSLGSCVAVFTR
jgi:hypothetical protein